MSVTLFASIVLFFARRDIFTCRAQETSGVLFPSIQENRTISNEQPRPTITALNKKTEWWPPAVPAQLDQEITQTSAYQYSPWLQQPPIPASYYVHAPIGQVRSEHYAYPSEYSEYGHPSAVVSQPSASALGIGSKHLAIISFIGLLLLFAVIQNSLLAAKRKDALVDALTGRKKRDLFITHGLRAMTPEQEEILNDDARLRCIQRTVCLENRGIIENFGIAGRRLATFLTQGVKKSVKTSSGWDRLVEDASEAGIRGENCDVLYRDCADTPVTSKFRRKAIENRRQATEQTVPDTSSNPASNNT